MSVRRTARKTPIRSLILLMILIASALCIARESGYLTQFTSQTEQTRSLSVTYLDVGQGNCIIIRNGDQTMIIDGGDSDHSSFVVSYLKQQNINTVDYMIATHYDSDHLSGLIGILHTTEVKKVFAPDYQHDTKTYRSFQSVISEKSIDLHSPLAGESYPLGDAEFTIVCPNSYSDEESNNNSIGIRLVHGDNSFLFLGDAEEASESAMLTSGLILDSDVYLASHHGSSSSSTAAFLLAVSPEAVVISSGPGNSYGHPHQAALERLAAWQPDLYRTDTLGTVIAESDGAQITWNKEPCDNWNPGSTDQKQNESVSAENASYIGNKNSFKFHLTTCSGLPAEKNRIYFQTREDAVNQGYDPCGSCKP